MRLAADQGDAISQYVDATSQYWVGVLFVGEDNAEAVRWFRLAADQGYADAQFDLGFVYANGVAVPKDNAEAVRWYRLAADQGIARAQNNLGGYATARFNLGIMYANGEGVLKDSVLAHMWFNIAGANAHETAREQRDNLEPDMTGDQISRATELARACMGSDYQDCEP